MTVDTSQVISHDEGGRPLYVGSVVNICADVAHLYDESGVSNGWVVEALAGVGLSGLMPLASRATPKALERAGKATVLCLRDKSTGNRVFAPSVWVTTGTPIAVAGAAARDELRDLALLLFQERNNSAGRRMDALTVWAIDYVHRTNSIAEKRDLKRDLTDSWPPDTMMNDVEWQHFIDVHMDSPTRLGAFVRSAFNRSRGGAEADTLREKIAELEKTLAEARKALGGV